jgi:hypothetical protein
MAGGIVGAVVGQIVGQLVSQTLSSLMSQFGQGNVLGALTNIFNEALSGGIKNAINGGPLPQFIKDAANSAVDDIFGNNQQPTTPECQCATEQSGIGQMVQDLVNQTMEEVKEEADKKADGTHEGCHGKGGGNWLEQLAKALAKVQVKFLNNALDAQKRLEKAADKAEGGSSQGAQSDFIEAQGEFQAAMQMFKQMSELAATAIKSVGEALSTLSRKQ